MAKVYIALGGNFPHSHDLILQAANLLEANPHISDLRLSKIYRSSPVNILDSDAFFTNACLSCEVENLSSADFFSRIEEIEVLLGKTPKEKTASRPIDIDLLFFGQEALDAPSLMLPHPAWCERLFVLLPLLDLTEIIYDPKTKQELNLKHLIHLLQQETDQFVTPLEMLEI